jgi:hypothetical protein
MTLDQYLTDLVCQVNKTYSGNDPLVLAAGATFPYLAIKADTKIQFFVKGIDYPLNHTGNAKTVKTNNMKEAGRAINIFLYNFDAAGGVHPLGRFVPVTSTAPTTEGGGPGQMDIIMLKNAGLTRGILAHELGHFFGLAHFDNSSTPPGGGLCNCPGIGSGDCVSDTPPVNTYSCNMADNTEMSQNVMQQGNSCQVFFTNGQKGKMDLTFASTSVTPLPCNRSLYVDPSPVLASHIPPPVNISRSGSVVTIKATYTSCIATAPVRFTASVARYDAPVTCREGVGVITGWNPSTILVALAPTVCTYRVTVRAMWADGSFYDYAPVVYAGTGFPPLPPYIPSSVYLWAQRFCQCTKPWIDDTKREATSENDIDNMENLIQVKEGDVIDVAKELGMESIESIMQASLTALELFPNPADNTISFKNYDATGCKYAITNVMGQVIDAGTVVSGSIAVHKLPAGQYFVQITDKADNRSNVMKFIKVE